ncbi:MAG: peptidylprolyl isomerase [Melioribacteraceae bacterium]|jgi:peptidyl-prolyl cis-trans isomerase SurA|nr:peptidylprolyl isomerase [Melioribacteraceae bacterium]
MKHFIIFILFTANLLAQQVGDKIVAVVDNEIILKSELDFRVNFESAQKKLNPTDPVIQNSILNQLIEEKLLYAQAELDSVTVTDEQVNQQLDNQINYFITQYGSKERLEQIYGMPIEKIRRNLRDDTRKNLMAQSVQQKKFGNIQVSRMEVEEFFNSFKDSLGIVPEKYQIAHIFQNPRAGDRIKQKARELALMLLDSLKKGGDFAELAKKYSNDPGSAAQGGDLGFVKRGVFYPEFEAAAFALAPNQLSGIIESPVGFHIIQLLERRGESIHSRHILIKLKADDEADLKSIEFLNDIRDSIVRGTNTFDYYAKRYSDDKENSRFGGELGIFEKSQLDKSLLDIIFKMKVGDISFPKRLEIDNNTYGYHIVKLIKRTSEHKAELDQDFTEIKRLTEYYKKQKFYSKWMEELKEKIFWEVRL